MEQIDNESIFENGDRMPTRMINESHLACVLLLDVSGSMSGAPIRNLNKAVESFKQQVSQDPQACKRVEVAIVTFGNEVEVLSGFTPLMDMPIYKLKAGGCTSMAEGVQKAVDLVKEQGHKYDAMGVPKYRPWIFMITDGASTSGEEAMKQAAQRVREEENKVPSRLKFWAIGVEGYEKEELFQFTDLVVELNQHNFTGIFDWLGKSMVQISNSRAGMSLELDPLPKDANVIRVDI